MTPRLEKLEIRCSCRRMIAAWTHATLQNAKQGEPRTCPCGAIYCLDRKELLAAVKVERRGKEQIVQITPGPIIVSGGPP